MSRFPEDSLVLDPHVIEQLRSQVDDYEQEFCQSDAVQKSTSTTTVGQDTNWLKGFERFFADEAIRNTVSILFLIVVVVGVCFALRNKFSMTAQRDILELTDEDTIYGIDFERQLRAMEESHDLYQCIRLRYLQLLRLLHDGRHIFWQESKTPRQYEIELGEPDFNALSQIFTRVRYGNYKPDDAMYAQMCGLCESVKSKIVKTEEG